MISAQTEQGESQATTNVNALITQFTSYDLYFIYIFLCLNIFIFMFFFIYKFIYIFLFVPPNHVDFKSLQYMGLGT